MYVCARACVRTPGRVDVCIRVRACSLAYPACNLYAPYCDVICGRSGCSIFFDIILEKAQFSGKKSYLIFLQLLSKPFLILRRIWRGTVINLKTSLCKINYALFLSDFNETWLFSTDFRKKLKYQVSSKSVQWEPSCSMLTDRPTWRS